MHVLVCIRVKLTVGALVVGLGDRPVCTGHAGIEDRAEWARVYCSCWHRGQSGVPADAGPARKDATGRLEGGPAGRQGGGVVMRHAKSKL